MTDNHDDCGDGPRFVSAGEAVAQALRSCGSRRLGPMQVAAESAELVHQLAEAMVEALRCDVPDDEAGQLMAVQVAATAAGRLAADFLTPEMRLFAHALALRTFADEVESAAYAVAANGPSVGEA